MEIWREKKPKTQEILHFFFFEKDTSLTIINIENRETKLNVHEGYTRAIGGKDQQAHPGVSTRLTPP